MMGMAGELHYHYSNAYPNCTLIEGLRKGRELTPGRGAGSTLALVRLTNTSPDLWERG